MASTEHAEHRSGDVGEAPRGVPDPLAALGHDIFVDVLSWLASVDDLLAVEQVCKSWRSVATAHSTLLWRIAAIDMGIDDVNIRACDKLALTGTWDVDENDHRPIVRDHRRLLRSAREPEGWLSARGSSRSTPLGTPGPEAVRVNWRYLCE